MYLLSYCRYVALNIFYKCIDTIYRRTNRDLVKKKQVQILVQVIVQEMGVYRMKWSHCEKYMHSQHQLIPAKNFYNVLKLHILNLTLIPVKKFL